MGNKKDLEKPIVLLVYEASTMRILIERNIKKQNSLVLYSSTYSSVTYIRDALKIDCLVVQLKMSSHILDALDVTRALRARFPKCPVLVFSESLPEDPRYSFLNKKNNIEFLSTPLDALFLGKKIKKAITTVPKLE